MAPFFARFLQHKTVAGQRALDELIGHGKGREDGEGVVFSLFRRPQADVLEPLLRVADGGLQRRLADTRAPPLLHGAGKLGVEIGIEAHDGITVAGIHNGM
jgi:hypothetical protein